MSSDNQTVLQQMTASPVELTLDSQPYKLSPLVVEDLAEIETWVRGAPYRRAKEQLLEMQDVLSPEERRRIIDRSDAEAAALADGLNAKATAAALQSIQGVRVMLFLGLRKNHADMTKDLAAKFVTMENLSAIKKALDQVNKVPGAEGKAKGRKPQRGT